MNNKLYLYWLVSEISAAALLQRGFETWMDVTGFLTSHGLCILVTYLLFATLIGTDRFLRKRLLTRGFVLFLMGVSLIPMTGPPLALFIILFLRFYPIYPVRTESFEKVSKENLMVFRKRFEGRVLPITEALLIRGLSRPDALRMLAVVGEMGWSSTKSGLLRYMIRLSPYQNVILMAIDMLRKKTDEILSEVVRHEDVAATDQTSLQRLANLYHEIVYLDLCEPVMKQFYKEKACDYAVAAFERSGSEDDALLSVKYLLEADKVQEAKNVYDRVREKGDYFFPKWVTYEFELSVRLRENETFNNLYLLIETAGGVFIPDRVKEAAKAWRSVLTSAWL